MLSSYLHCQIIIHVPNNAGDAEPADIQILSQNLTIPSGSFEASVRLFDLVDDDNLESREGFLVVATNTSIPGLSVDMTLNISIFDPEGESVGMDF